MLKNLCKKEIFAVAGGIDWSSIYPNRFECMGEGRNVTISCLDKDNNNVRGWAIRPDQFFCGVWFCCSGDKQEGDKKYHFLVIGNNKYNCKTGEYTKIEVKQEL